MVKLIKSPSNRFYPILVFQLTQHSRDEQLMKSLIEYLECGNVNRDRTSLKFEVTKLNDIQNKIIPFFF